jgi:heptaprenyl diphosphate synthase
MIKDESASPLTFEASLEAAKSLIQKTLLASDPVISEEMGHLTLQGGKNIRAMLLLSCAVDKEGKVSPNAVVAAAVLEILHLATLIHDDIIDESETRRGEMSLQRRFGKKAAVICGDYLFCKCFTMVSDISSGYPEKYRDISQAMTKICLGELRQFKHNKDFNLSVYQYLRIIAGKTSALFSLSMYAGSILGEGNEQEARYMARIGYYIGMLFQISDDCMDYQADFKKAKKTVKHDLYEGVVTLPLIYALRGSPCLKDRMKDGRITASEVLAIISEVVHTGGVTMAMVVAEKYYTKANKLIAGIEDQNKRAILMQILEKLKVNPKT